MKLLAVVWFAVFLTPLAHAQRYEYVNPLHARHTLAIQLEPAFFSASGRAIDVSFCIPATKFICVESDEFNFAFPLNRAPEQNRWALHGFTYELQRREKLQLLGQSWPVWIVESVQGIKTMHFAYSEERGILAMSGTLSDSSATFVSMSTRGFGAQPKAKTLTPRTRAQVF